MNYSKQSTELILPFQSEINFPVKYDSLRTAQMIIFARNIHQKKSLIIIENIRFNVGINLTKPAQVLGKSINEIRSIITNEFPRGKIIDQQSLKLFHEYSPDLHEYLLLEFFNGQDYSAFIRAFNQKTATINSDNSYLCDDEYTSSLIYKFCRENNLSLCDWCQLTFYKKEDYKEVTIYYSSRLSDIIQIDQSDAFLQKEVDLSAFSNINDFYNKRLLIAYWDTETYSEEFNSVQQITQDVEASKNNNIAYNSIPFIISISFCWSDEKEPFANFALSTVDYKLSITNRAFIKTAPIAKNEKELLQQFIQLLSSYKPDIISGFNDNSFDWTVITQRAIKYNLLDNLYKALSLQQYYYSQKITLLRQFCQEKEIKIKGNDIMNCQIYSFHGCIAVDTMCIFRKLYPNDDRYSLNHFLEKLKLSLKEDMPYDQLEIHRKNILKDSTNEEYLLNMGKVISYCVNDSISLLRLWQARKVLSDNRELAKLSFTDLEHSFFRAGGSKVRNMVIGFIKKYTNIAVSNTRRISSTKGKYSGAHVIDINNVLNRTNPLACLDFSSLYPSIIIAYNFSPEMTISEEMLKYYKDDNPLNYQRNIQITVQGEEIIGRIIWHNNEEKRMGVYAKILKSLFERRTHLKNTLETLKAQKQNTTLDQQTLKKIEVDSDIIDTQQLALKILMNTFYGEAGNSISPFYNLLVAGSITDKGQKLLMYVQQIAANNNWTTWYGDTDSIYISAPEQELQVINQESYSDLREQWKAMINYTITNSQKLTTIINKSLEEFTNTTYLKMAYEKVLFPSIFFSKKRYVGYKHEKEAVLNHGQEQLLISGFQIKKKGNAPILAVIGEEILETLLQPLPFLSIHSLVQQVLNKYFKSFDIKYIDLFTITETYRSNKNNIKVKQFIAALPQQYKINNLAKFDYVFVTRDSYNEYTGKKIKDCKSRHMLLKCQYLENPDKYQLDIYQYITGSIKGVLVAFLQLETDKETATKQFTALIKEFDCTKKDEMLTTKKLFKERCKSILQQSNYKSINFSLQNYFLHLSKKLSLQSEKLKIYNNDSTVEISIKNSLLTNQDLLFTEIFNESKLLKQNLSELEALFKICLNSKESKVTFERIIIQYIQLTNQEILSIITDFINQIKIYELLILQKYCHYSALIKHLELSLEINLNHLKLQSLIQAVIFPTQQQNSKKKVSK